MPHGPPSRFSSPYNPANLVDPPFYLVHGGSTAKMRNYTYIAGAPHPGPPTQSHFSSDSSLNQGPNGPPYHPLENRSRQASASAQMNEHSNSSHFESDYSSNYVPPSQRGNYRGRGNSRGGRGKGGQRKSSLSQSHAYGPSQPPFGEEVPVGPEEKAWRGEVDRKNSELVAQALKKPPSGAGNKVQDTSACAVYLDDDRPAAQMQQSQRRPSMGSSFGNLLLRDGLQQFPVIHEELGASDPFANQIPTSHHERHSLNRRASVAVVIPEGKEDWFKLWLPIAPGTTDAEIEAAISEVTAIEAVEHKERPDQPYVYVR